MPSFASRVNLLIFLRSITLHVGFSMLLSKLFDRVGVTDHFPLEASSVCFWALTMIGALIYGKAVLEIVPYFGLPSIADLFRQIPQHQIFDYLIEELRDLVQNNCPNALLLEENPVRNLALTVFKIIYKVTGGSVVAGFIMSAILITFLAQYLSPALFHM